MPKSRFKQKKDVTTRNKKIGANKNAESIRGTALGVLFVFAGAVGQISNVFKLKRAGKQLQQAGKQLKKIKWFS